MEILKTIFPTYDQSILNDLYTKYDDVEYVVNFVLNDIVRKNDEELLKHITDVNIETRELKKYEKKQNNTTEKDGQNAYRKKKLLTMRNMFRRQTKAVSTTRPMDTPLLNDYVPENYNNGQSSMC